MTNEPATLACPTCGHENPEDSRFCLNCGRRVDGLCPNCGADNPAASHFCGACGFDLLAAPRENATQDLRHQSQPQMGVVCPRCHHSNEPGALFCYQCGLPLDGETGFRPAGLRGIAAYATARPAGFWARLVGAMIDSIILVAALSVLVLALTDVSPNDYFTDPDTNSGTGDLIGLILNGLYAPILIAIWATTVGKRAFSMYVVRPDGSRVGFGRAFGRELAKVLSAAILLIGFLMIAVREDKRGLHDLIADTVVVMR